VIHKILFKLSLCFYIIINWWIDKGNVVCIHSGVLFSHKEVWNYVVCRKMDGTGDYHVEQDKLSSERKYHVFCSYVESRPKRN
jgi:hypothetical protein